MVYSKGIFWLDDCRIPFVDEKEKEGVCKSDKTKKTYNEDWGNTIYNYKRTGGDTKGRFTPNLLVCDDMLNDGSVSKSGKGAIRKNTKNEGSVGFMADSKKEMKMKEYDDKGSNSRYYSLDLWFNKMIEKL